jgi:hypothetical protein
MHKLFISYYHENDQEYKEYLLILNEDHKNFMISLPIPATFLMNYMTLLLEIKFETII